MQPSPGWSFNTEALLTSKASVIMTGEVEAKLIMFISNEDTEEFMLSWEPVSPIIVEAVIWYEEYLDKVTRRIPVASAMVIQHFWRLHKVDYY